MSIADLGGCISCSYQHKNMQALLLTHHICTCPNIYVTNTYTNIHTRSTFTHTEFHTHSTFTHTPIFPPSIFTLAQSDTPTFSHTYVYAYQHSRIHTQSHQLSLSCSFIYDSIHIPTHSRTNFPSHTNIHALTHSHKHSLTHIQNSTEKSTIMGRSQAQCRLKPRHLNTTTLGPER